MRVEDVAIKGVAIKAVVFDIGGVLEKVGDDSWLGDWRRVGMSDSELDSALAGVDPEDLIQVGRLRETEYLQRYVDALGVSAERAGAFRAALWDWYCGELDTDMCTYAASLRPRYQTAILSNSSDGARREEEARWGFEQLVDVVLYSHEVGLAKPDPRIYQLTCDRLQVGPAEMVFIDDVPAIVESAARFGIHAVLHEGAAADTIAAVDALLAATT